MIHLFDIMAYDISAILTKYQKLNSDMINIFWSIDQGVQQVLIKTNGYKLVQQLHFTVHQILNSMFIYI